jgi:hypothetical protein
MRRRRDSEAARIADEIVAARARCPQAIAMEARFREALDRWPRHHRIEQCLLALGYDVEAGRELKPEEAHYFEEVLQQVEEVLASGVPA